VHLANKQGNLAELSIGALPNNLEQKFEMNRKKVFNILIFRELAKALACELEAKVVVAKLLTTAKEC